MAAQQNIALDFGAALAALEDRVRGEVIQPGDSAFEEARQVWNAAVNRRPAVIVRVARASDVAEAVRFANAYGLRIAVRSGGHGMAGHATIDDGLVIDLSHLRDIRIDPVQKLAWVQPGVVSVELARKAQQHGLALSTGDTGSVGIGGLAVAGGVGWFVRRYGLALDALEAVEIVTADGRVLEASEEQHSELFWAVRGGGGNFGIVTGMRFRLHDSAEVLAGMIAMPSTPRALAEYARIAEAAPDALTTQAIVLQAWPDEWMPAERVGQPLLLVIVCWSGDIEEGRRVIEPFTHLDGPAYVDLTRPMAYPEIFELAAEGDVWGRTHHVRSAFLDELDGELLEALTTSAGPGHSIAQLRVLGGEFARVPSDATAFAHRARRYMLLIEASGDDEEEAAAAKAWAEDLFAVVAPRARGVYVNFLGEDAVERLREAYPPATYERLAAVKAAYDPCNVFRGNHNIRPARRGR